MDAKEFKKLVKWCKKHQISHYNVDGVEFKIDLGTKASAPSDTTDLPPANPEAGMPSDSEMMLWSSPAFEAQIGKKDVEN